MFVICSSEKLLRSRGHFGCECSAKGSVIEEGFQEVFAGCCHIGTPGQRLMGVVTGLSVVVMTRVVVAPVVVAVTIVMAFARVRLRIG